MDHKVTKLRQYYVVRSYLIYGLSLMKLAKPLTNLKTYLNYLRNTV